MHGTTVHGAQRVKTATGGEVAAPLPATYYYPLSPMARGVEAARLVSGKADGGLSVGIVGLGSGSLACYSRGNEAWRFYEIDPVVVKLASDPRLFYFLPHCRPGADIVVGDARVTLAKEPAGAFDYLVIDAFSSDAVPMHLLTREALQLYLGKLAPNGLLALHVSNRHLDLVSVAGAVARSIPGAVAALADDRPANPGFDRSVSQVVFVAKSQAALAPVLAWKDAKAIEAGAVQPWTDDFSDILGAILRRYLAK
jgi:spermidine synthase